MSHFYGTVKGNRGKATRCGTKSSGLEVNAASWEGSINVRIWYDEKIDKDIFEVRQSPWEGCGTSNHIASGVIGDQKNDQKND